MRRPCCKVLAWSTYYIYIIFYVHQWSKWLKICEFSTYTYLFFYSNIEISLNPQILKSEKFDLYETEIYA